MPYKPVYKPMKHQLEALRASSKKPDGDDAFAYLMEMGTGKTKVVLDEWGEWAADHRGPPQMLVIGPAGSYRNWFEGKTELQKSQIEDHMDPAFVESLAVDHWSSGGGRAKRNRLKDFLKSRKKRRALFVNIESLRKQDDAYELCREFMEKELTHMVVDESTTIKSHSAKQAKNVVELGKEAMSRRIMSGLWTPQSPMDTFMQCKFLSDDILKTHSYYGFRRTFAVLKKMEFGGRKVDVVVGYQNIDTLHKRIAPWSYRKLKSECLDLEPKTYVIREVEQTPEQRRMYKEMREYATIALSSGSFSSAQLAIVQMMRLHQINCGFLMDDDRVLQEVPENRTDTLMSVLSEHAGKAIVWCPFTHYLKKIVRRINEEFGEGSAAAFWGGNVKERGAEERRFLGDPKCRFMVSTQSAGGMGNTWTVADLEVYAANTHNLEHRYQSEDRAHRAGQKRKVTIVDLVAPETVDVKILHALRKKINMSTMITGENWREWVL